MFLSVAIKLIVYKAQYFRIFQNCLYGKQCISFGTNHLFELFFLSLHKATVVSCKINNIPKTLWLHIFCSNHSHMHCQCRTYSGFPRRVPLKLQGGVWGLVQNVVPRNKYDWLAYVSKSKTVPTELTTKYNIKSQAAVF